MTSVIVRIAFDDFPKWKTVFDEAGPLRKSYGSKGVRVLRNIERPNEAMIVGEYEDLTKARQLFQSQEFHETTKRAGVSGPPDVFFLDEVDQLPA